MATLTLVPTISEFTFAQEVTIRDRDGFVLASDSLQGRFVSYFGVGRLGRSTARSIFWSAPDEEKLTGDQAKQDFSRRLLPAAQLSSRSTPTCGRCVLRGFEPAGRRRRRHPAQRQPAATGHRRLLMFFFWLVCSPFI